MIKVHPEYCEVFARNTQGKLELVYQGFKYANSHLKAVCVQLQSNGYTEIEALRGGEPIW